jgi:hypothetical protein
MESQTEKIGREVTDEKLKKYFEVTGKAIEMVKTHEMDIERIDNANDFLDMAQRYYNDAGHFKSNGDYVTAFAALNYAHGWLDAGARIGLFKVKDSTLFTVDDD